MMKSKVGSSKPIIVTNLIVLMGNLTKFVENPNTIDWCKVANMI